MIFLECVGYIFLRQKSNFFSVFRKFQKIVEKQSGCLIKKFRNNRGGEYNSKEFEKFYEDVGLKRQLTVGYIPEQNGAAERKNRIIIEMTRMMIKEKEFPLTFLAKATCMTVYLLNRCPTKAVENKTQIEI
jgi:transposase InsO family protein